MKMKHIIISLVALPFMVLQWEGYTQEQYFQIINAYEFSGGVLEEWKSPGKYSPINMFDNDITTCFAEGNEDDNFILDIQLEQPITCDRMQILGGVAKNDDLFMKNNRPKEVKMWLYESEDAFKKDKETYSQTVILEDKKEYQEIVFNKPCRFKRFAVQVFNAYKGTKYDDTCVTELKLFNGGVEVKPKDIGKMKKVYLQRVGERLKEFLRPGSFDVSEGLCEAVIDGKGYIKWRNVNNPTWIYYEDEVIKLKRLFVKDAQLYVEYGKKIYLAEYILRYYVEYPERQTSLVTSLSVRNIGGINKNNLGFMRKDQLELIDKIYEEFYK